MHNRAHPPVIEHTSSDPAPSRQRKALGLLIVVGITAFSFWLALNPAWVSWAGTWGYFGAFLISLIASATIVLPAPGLVVVIAMGTALDPILLGIWSGAGSAIGEMSGYYAGVNGSAFIPERQRHYVERLDKLTRHYGAWLLFFLSAIPFPLFDVAGMVAGALRMRISSFLISVAAGKSIKYTVLILFGSNSIVYLSGLLLQWMGE